MALTDVHRRQKRLTPQTLDLITKLLDTRPRTPDPAVTPLREPSLLDEFDKLDDPEVRERVLTLLELLAAP